MPNVMATIGIRREDKNKWERRVPITPEHVHHLKQVDSITTVIQPSPIRIFTDDKYHQKEAIIKDDLTECPVIFGVKEIPSSFFQQRKTYVFFSHTIKGQSYNMPMLKLLMELECTLIDYEKIMDTQGRRLVFFGRYAGIAGMIDTLWAFGQRLKAQGYSTPFQDIKPTISYDSLDEIRHHFQHIRNQLTTQRLPPSISPIIVGFAGYGHVSQGAQEIYNLLPIKEVQPEDLPALLHSPSHQLYKVVFKELHMAQPLDQRNQFNLQEYYTHPDRYTGVFERHLPYLSILMNCIYWDKRYPRLVSKEYVKQRNDMLRLHIIGDISVDINGAIELTEKTTNPDVPTYVYNTATGAIQEGVQGEGIVIMAVDNLPCELPRASSRNFSKSLLPFIPWVAKADYTQPFHSLNLPDEVKKAVILHQGKLTPDYQYIEDFL